MSTVTKAASAFKGSFRLRVLVPKADERGAQAGPSGIIWKCSDRLFRALRGKRSKRARKAKKALAGRHRKVANRRKNRVHKVTAALVRKHALIVTEELAIKDTTASARGTAENPGKNFKKKAAQNRAFLDATPGSFVNVLLTKAEEAKCQVVFAGPVEASPVANVLSLWHRPQEGSERMHHCGCGAVATRDQNAALSMLADGLRLLGREPAWAARPETPARAA